MRRSGRSSCATGRPSTQCWGTLSAYRRPFRRTRRKSSSVFLLRSSSCFIEAHGPSFGPEPTSNACAIRAPIGQPLAARPASPLSATAACRPCDRLNQKCGPLLTQRRVYAMITRLQRSLLQIGLDGGPEQAVHPLQRAFVNRAHAVDPHDSVRISEWGPPTLRTWVYYASLLGVTVTAAAGIGFTRRCCSGTNTPATRTRRRARRCKRCDSSAQKYHARRHHSAIRKTPGRAQLPMTRPSNLRTTLAQMVPLTTQQRQSATGTCRLLSQH